MREVLGTKEREVEVSGLEEVGTFSIAANAKAFKTLIDSLYSDKPRAIIRELWSNAYDSHIAAGIMDRRFYCQLPTVWEPEFRVRDYGVSLTHEQVMKLYTTVFQSTKEDTNSQVGKFGLGSKTPFAYADSYTITAILNGEKRTYNAFIDAKGIPRIGLFHSEPTEEEQGLEVSFPVQQKDVKAFEIAAHRVAMGFEVVPKNNLEIEKKEMKVVVEGDGWKLLARDANWGRQGVQVRQGCVLYPVDTMALARVRQSKAVEALASEPIILDMPIGSVDITPSRESLSYDEITSNNLIKKFEEIFETFIRRANEKITHAPSLIDAVRTRHAVLTEISNSQVKHAIIRNLRWHGRKVPEDLTLHHEQLNRLRRHGLNIQDVERAWYKRELPKLGNASYLPIDLNQPVKFYYWTGETPKHLAYRLRALIETQKHRHHFHVIPDYRPNSLGAGMLKVMLLRRADVEFIDLTELPFEVPERKHVLAKLRRWRDGDFVECEMPPPDRRHVFYIGTNQAEPEFCGHVVSRQHLGRLWRLLIDQNMIDRDAVLIGIPKTRRDIAKIVPPQWRSLQEELLDLIGEFDPQSVSRYMARDTSYERNRSLAMLHKLAELTPKSEGVLASVARGIRAFADDAAYGEIFFALEPFAKKMPEWMKDAFYREFCRINKDMAIKEIDRMLISAKHAYPLLTPVTDLSTPRMRRAAKDYIALVDQRDAAERLNDLAWA